MDEQQYLSNVLSPLLGFSDELIVERTTDDRGVLLTVSVNPQDMGRVIGRQGETIKSIRRLVRQYGSSREMMISIRLNEPPEGRTSQM